MTTPAPSFAAISRVVLQPWSVRTTVSVFCFKSAISASCFPGLTFSRLIKITDSSVMAYLLVFRTHQGRPEGWKRIAAEKIFLCYDVVNVLGIPKSRGNRYAVG